MVAEGNRAARGRDLVDLRAACRRMTATLHCRDGRDVPQWRTGTHVPIWKDVTRVGPRVPGRKRGLAAPRIFGSDAIEPE